MTTECAFCPRCGHDLALEQRVEVGPLINDPRGAARWCGRIVALPPSEHIILGTLARAGGALVATDILAERIGYERDGNVVDVHLSRLRRRFREAGAPATLFPNVRRRGHRLNVEMLESFARDVARPPC